MDPGRLTFFNQIQDLVFDPKARDREDFITWLIENAVIHERCDDLTLGNEGDIEYAVETLVDKLSPLSPYSDAIAEMHFREGEEKTCFRPSKSPCGLGQP